MPASIVASKLARYVICGVELRPPCKSCPFVSSLHSHRRLSKWEGCHQRPVAHIGGARYERGGVTFMQCMQCHVRLPAYLLLLALRV